MATAGSYSPPCSCCSSGSLNTIEGIAAISNAHIFVHNTSYVFGDLNTWGWIVLCLGVVQLVVGGALFLKNEFARWTGVAVLTLNAIAQLLMMPAYPFWSLTFFAIDLIAIYGLTVHGKRSQTKTASRWGRPVERAGAARSAGEAALPSGGSR